MSEQTAEWKVTPSVTTEPGQVIENFPFQGSPQPVHVPSFSLPQVTFYPATQMVRSGTDWKEQFKPEELLDKAGVGKCVRLRGLQRCANMCGLIESYPEIRYIEGRAGKAGIMQCIYHVRFTDGAHFAGAADVNDGNVEGVFVNYPTSVAESRAEARALKKALGITDMLAAEEVEMSGGQTGQKELVVTDKIEAQQVAAINMIASQLKFDLAKLLEEVFPADRAKSIHALEELTAGEGVQLLQFLNEKRSSLPTQPINTTSIKKIKIDKDK